MPLPKRSRLIRHRLSPRVTMAVAISGMIGFAATEVPLCGVEPVLGGAAAAVCGGLTAGAIAGAGAALEAAADGFGGAILSGRVIGCVARAEGGEVGAAVATTTGASNGTSARETTLPCPLTASARSVYLPPPTPFVMVRDHLP